MITRTQFSEIIQIIKTVGNIEADIAIDVADKICNVIEKAEELPPVMITEVLREHKAEEGFELTEKVKQNMLRSGMGTTNSKGEFVPQGRRVTATDIHKVNG